MLPCSTSDKVLQTKEFTIRASGVSIHSKSLDLYIWPSVL